MIANRNRPQSGFVILFSVLLVSIVLTISLSLFNITLKQLILSSTARESQAAFFAADSAINCVRHWNALELNTDGTTSNPFGFFDVVTSNFIGSDGSEPICADVVVGVDRPNPPTDPEYVTSFRIRFVVSPDRTSCADVRVGKQTTDGITSILVNGYNACDDDGSPIVSDRTVQRTLSFD